MICNLFKEAKSLLDAWQTNTEWKREGLGIKVVLLYHRSSIVEICIALVLDSKDLYQHLPDLETRV